MIWENVTEFVQNSITLQIFLGWYAYVIKRLALNLARLNMITFSGVVLRCMHLKANFLALTACVHLLFYRGTNGLLKGFVSGIVLEATEISASVILCGTELKITLSTKSGPVSP